MAEQAVQDNPVDGPSPIHFFLHARTHFHHYIDLALYAHQPERTLQVVPTSDVPKFTFVAGSKYIGNKRWVS
jgi:hypothetical protein